MKKTLLLSLIVFTFSLATMAQKKDSTKPVVDTVFIVPKTEMQMIVELITQNAISYQGKQLTYADLQNILAMINSRASLIPRKEQPRK